MANRNGSVYPTTNTVGDNTMPIREHKLTVTPSNGGFSGHCACGYTYLWRRTNLRFRNEQHAGHLNRVRKARAAMKNADRYGRQNQAA